MSAFYSFENDNNQRVLPNATVLLTTTACGVDLVYWILWLSLGKLVLVGHSNQYIECHNDVANFLRSYIAHPGYGIRNVDYYNIQYCNFQFLC